MRQIWYSKHIALPLLLLFATASLQAREPVVGQPAPPVVMKMPDNTKVSLQDLRGKVVVINFWATWCGPCKQELPLLDAYFKVQRKAGLEVFAVTTEDSVPLSYLKPLAAKLTIPLIKSFHGNYGPLGGVPTNYVIDRAGVLRYAKANAFDLDDLNAGRVPGCGVA